jgi:hypothetical protein
VYFFLFCVGALQLYVEKNEELGRSVNKKQTIQKDWSPSLSAVHLSRALSDTCVSVAVVKTENS